MSEQPLSRDGADLEEVAGFLRGALPFNELDDALLARAVSSLRIAYHPRGARFDADSPRPGLRILRSGAVDIRGRDNALLDRLGEGESFHIGGLNAQSGGVIARVIEDSLVYRLPDEVYAELRGRHRGFDRYFTRQRSRRLRRAARWQPEPHALLAPLSSVMTREVLSVPPETSVQQVAVAMAERRVSSALVVEHGDLRGVITDRDLRTRVLAVNLAADTPVREVMTADPETIAADESLFAATLRMTRRGYHHVPVLEDGRLAGVVTTSDLILARRDDPVYLVQHISRQHSVDAIRERLDGMADLVLHWVQGGMPAPQVSQLLTAISDAVAARLIALAEDELGPAPAPWCWLAFGSQARSEQLLGADQDNGIVIDDSATAADLAWYRELAARVCEGLDRCGYRYCPGGIMASTASWCQRLTGWKDTVRSWTRTPTADAVMRVGIFFDIRALAGEFDLAAAVQRAMLRAGGNSIFLAALAANALDNRPPLGIFRRFVVERNGEHRDSLDIKKRGVLPVTEIARLHALARGVAAVNTEARLLALAEGRFMSLADSRNLIDALHCVQRVRMQHQCEQALSGATADNYVNPRKLPRLAREQLRDAFTIIDEAQAALRQTYRAGLG